MRASLLLGSSVLLLAAAGCGSSSDSSSKPSKSSSSSSSSSKALTVESKEYSFTPGSLQAKSGKVKFTLDPLDGEATRVTIQEQFTDGPLLGVRNKVGDVLLHLRNTEVLQRLADLSERR